MARKRWNPRDAFRQIHNSGINGVHAQSFIEALRGFFVAPPPPIPIAGSSQVRVKIARLHFDRIADWEYVFSSEGMCLKDICGLMGWNVREVRMVLLEMVRNGEKLPMTKSRAERRRLTKPNPAC